MTITHFRMTDIMIFKNIKFDTYTKIKTKTKTKTKKYTRINL